MLIPRRNDFVNQTNLLPNWLRNLVAQCRSKAGNLFHYDTSRHYASCRTFQVSNWRWKWKGRKKIKWAPVTAAYLDIVRILLVLDCRNMLFSGLTSSFIYYQRLLQLLHKRNWTTTRKSKLAWKKFHFLSRAVTGHYHSQCKGIR